MLLSKIKISSAVLLLGLVLTAGVTGVTYRSQAAGGTTQERADDDASSRSSARTRPLTSGGTIQERADDDANIQKVEIEQRTPPGKRGESPATFNVGRILGELIGTDDPTPRQLEYAKGLIEGLLETDTAAEGKSAQEIDELIKEAVERLDACRFEIRMLEAKVQRMKRIKAKVLQNAESLMKPE